MTRLLFDLETDGLLNTVSVIHCLVTIDMDTGAVEAYHDDPEVLPKSGSIADGIKTLEAADVLLGHNIIEYDLEVLKKLTDFESSAKILDTVVMSRLAFSDRKERDFALFKQERIEGKYIGSHSLGSWGSRLGYSKGEWSDWTAFSQGMLDYCIRDCKVNKRLYGVLEAQMPSEATRDYEHRFATILWEQQKRGAPLDREAGEALLGELVARRATLEDQIHAAFPPQLEWYKKRKDTGKRTHRWCPVRNGRFPNKLVPFNPNSRPQLAARLIKDHGWVPQELSRKTLKPLMHEAILLDLAEVYPEVKPVAEFYIVNSRISLLQEGDSGYFALCDDNDVLHGRTIHIGAVTHRCTHSKPNTGNVTSLRKPYGKAIRSLFVPFDRMDQAGFDADGLELRMLAHYLAPLDDGKYIDAVLHGSKDDGTDAHSIHAKAISTVYKVTRDQSKNFTYAFLYGAGDAKLGKMAGGGTRATGKKIKRAMAKHVTGLGPLLAGIRKAVEGRGYIESLDGRRVGIRSPHAALNTLLQSAGAVVMKYITIAVDDICKREGIEFLQTGHIHDEVQGSLWPKDREAFQAAVNEASVWAAEELNLRLPISCTAKFGASWADTH